MITDTVTIGLANNVAAPSLMPRPHRHNDVELNFVQTGAMTYVFGSERVTIQAGQLALFWATIPHQLVVVEAQTYFHWLTIPFSTFLQWQLADVLNQHIIRGQFIVYPVRDPSAQLASFERWHQDLKENSAEHRKIVLLEVEAHLRRLLLTPADKQHAEDITRVVEQPGGVAGHEQSKVEQMACYIAEHYTERLQVEEVAGVVYLHPNYAMHLFRTYFGVSITGYITQHRIAHAQRLLLMTDENASAIALEAGFGSVSQFYTAFKKACGQSPRVYRMGLNALLPSPGERF